MEGWQPLLGWPLQEVGTGSVTDLKQSFASRQYRVQKFPHLQQVSLSGTELPSLEAAFVLPSPAGLLLYGTLLYDTEIEDGEHRVRSAQALESLPRLIYG